jgi:hypothetical protein
MHTHQGPLSDPAVEPAIVGLFELRNQVNVVTTYEELCALAKVHGMPSPEPRAEWNGASFKLAGKELIQYYHGLHFRHANTLDEHRLVLDTITQSLADHFSRYGSRSILYCFGSYAMGKIRSFLSDFDGILFLDQHQRELDLLSDLGEIGLLFPASLNNLDDIRAVIATGRGVARLFGMSTSGVEVEFHVIGTLDRARLLSISPGFLRRVRPVPGKYENYVSNTGIELKIWKDSERIWNYVRHEGEVCRGFYSQNLLESQVVYDGVPPIGAKFLQLNFEKAVGAYLYHNGLLIRNQRGELSGEVGDAEFDAFMRTIFDRSPARFSPQRLGEMRDRFDKAVASL